MFNRIDVTMINATVVLLTGLLEPFPRHPLAKRIPGNLDFDVRIDQIYHNPLKEVFARVIVYEYTKRILEVGVKGINEELIELVHKEHPRYIIWLAAGSEGYEFQESTFDAIRKEGCRIVGWFADDYRFETYYKWWLPHVDYCITLDFASIPKYRALGARVIQTFPCEGIPFARDWSKVNEKFDIVFIGTRSNPSRERYLNELTSRNMLVKLFGRDLGGSVPFEEMMDIFWKSKINLNFSMSTRGEQLGLKGRLPLVCLAGGFLLTEYAPGLEEYFELDKEIVCFKNTEEMIDKINYYLSHDEERRAIARAGWERACNEYTPFHMHSRVFDEIERDIAGGNTAPLSTLKTPRIFRNNFSNDYFKWGKIFLEANYKGLWEDALSMSLTYNRANFSAAYYRFIGFLPASLRSPFFQFYKIYQSLEKALLRARHMLLCWADSIPGLRSIKKSVARKYY